MSEKALEVSELFVSIGEAKILDGVSFAVARKERLGIIGPNGSGKTTLFNTLSGFSAVTSGRIHLLGKDITRLPPSKRAMQGLGRVFQNFGIFREMTLLENMLTAIEAKRGATINPWGSKHRSNCASAREYLAEVGLEAKASQRAGSLSGGQMRLLEIMRSVAFGADVFLLDEPTAGVSPKMKEDIIKLLVKLEAMQKTLLIIEHDIHFIQSLCDRVLVLDQGKIVLDGNPETVRADRRLQEIYFGSADSGSSSETLAAAES